MSHLCLPLHTLLQSDRDRVVVSCGDRSTTAAALVTQVAALSRALTDQLAVLPGERVVLLGLNSDVLWTCLLAVLDAGAVACPLNWRWSAAELAAAVRLLQPKVLLVDDHCIHLAQQACSSIAGNSASSSSSTSPAPWALVRMCPAGSMSASAAASRQQGSQYSMAGELLSTSHLLLQAQSPAAAAAAAAASTCRQQALSSPPSQELQLQLQLLHPAPTQPALIVFTSGTTGASKGVMLSHNSLTHQSLAKLAVVQYTSSDTYLHMAPLFHVGGLSSAFAVLMAGGTHVFMPRYSPATALQLIRQYSVTSLIAVPAMMQDLTQTAAAAAAAAAEAGGSSQGQHQQHQLPSLQKVLVGAGGMPLRLQQAVAALFPRAALHTAYGMTEASSSMTFISVAHRQQLMAAAAAAAAASEMRQPGAAATAAAGVCVGKPGPGIAVRINSAGVDGSSSSSSGTTGPRRQQQQQQQQSSNSFVGEVCTRGPHVMLGYWQDPLATSKTLSPDGWLHTGDLGFMDAAGNLWLVGRLKDMVKSGGENVHAAEVEGVLLSHPAVAAAAVFGLEHARLGEQVAAAVVLQPGWQWEQQGLMLPVQQDAMQQQQQQQGSGQQQVFHGVVSEAQLQQHCRALLLSGYKLPRLMVCAQQLPCNSSGKVVKALLKQQVQQLLAAGQEAAADSSNSNSSSGRHKPAGSRLLVKELRSKL